MDKEDDIELNKFGRPKQKVIFYELTEEMIETSAKKL